ncbi:hypothetical protein [Croceicoccus sp. BE223]|uniref:hypothetical protein n=1 Tax=Croceicoccus sp. BE223 TaxID=2817716 RepID=UPI00285C68C4|nr:hypothetical protein [Croceicoccus sp. BE223]MDR7101513.1 hypothetical protein [Croceicoccus sp. BE223]
MGDGISDGQVDLFGLPVLPEKGRGRPAHVWTRENSDVVNLLFACGRKPIEIARVLKVSKPTFYKHYFNEIANAGHAPLMLKGRQLARLNKAAEEGNVAAEKALAAMVHAEQQRALSEKVQERGKVAAPAPRLGKKEQQKEAAAGVAGRFGTRQPPPAMIQ